MFVTVLCIVYKRIFSAVYLRYTRDEKYYCFLLRCKHHKIPSTHWTLNIENIYKRTKVMTIYQSIYLPYVYTNT
jgi:hypothetical protein